MIAAKKVYKRRSTYVANCTDLAIESITNTGQQGCESDGLGDPCTWIGDFVVATFNDRFDDDTVTYQWDVTVGEGFEDTSAWMDPEIGENENHVRIYVSSDRNTLIRVHCVVDTTGGLHGNDGSSIEYETQQVIGVRS